MTETRMIVLLIQHNNILDYRETFDMESAKAMSKVLAAEALAFGQGCKILFSRWYDEKSPESILEPSEVEHSWKGEVSHKTLEDVQREGMIFTKIGWQGTNAWIPIIDYEARVIEKMRMREMHQERLKKRPDLDGPRKLRREMNRFRANAKQSLERKFAEKTRQDEILKRPGLVYTCGECGAKLKQEEIWKHRDSQHHGMEVNYVGRPE